MAKYIYEYKNWTDFTWENADIHSIFGEVRWMQGKIIGQMNALGFSAKEEATFNALTLDVVYKIPQFFLSTSKLNKLLLQITAGFSRNCEFCSKFSFTFCKNFYL
jgi:hypothetical protein